MISPPHQPRADEERESSRTCCFKLVGRGLNCSVTHPRRYYEAAFVTEAFEISTCIYLL